MTTTKETTMMPEKKAVELVKVGETVLTARGWMKVEMVSTCDGGVNLHGRIPTKNQTFPGSYRYTFVAELGDVVEYF